MVIGYCALSDEATMTDKRTLTDWIGITITAGAFAYLLAEWLA